MTAASPFRVDGKVAIVTGSSRGIGRSIAETLASLGAKVVISSRKAEACEAVAADIRAQGGDADVVPCNVSRKDEVALVAEAIKAWAHRHPGLQRRGQPGLWPDADLPTRCSTRSWAPTSRATCGSAIWRSPAWPSAATAPSLSCPRSPACAASPGIGGYGISKAADFSLARNLAAEWGPRNVRVNCIAPGLIQTDFARALWETLPVAKRNAETPLRRIGKPHEIGASPRFLRRRRQALSPARLSWPMAGCNNSLVARLTFHPPSVNLSLPPGLVCDQRLVWPRIGALPHEMAPPRALTIE